LSFKIETVDDKGLHISHRMQGFPPEGYELLPPNSPEYFYHEEVENHLDIGSVVTPLLANPEKALVTVEEDSTLPINPVLGWCFEYFFFNGHILFACDIIYVILSFSYFEGIIKNLYINFP
jgi:hypothetical protein